MTEEQKQVVLGLVQKALWGLIDDEDLICEIESATDGRIKRATARPERHPDGRIKGATT